MMQTLLSFCLLAAVADLGSAIRCQASYDIEDISSNCTNLFKPCDRETHSCGTILLNTTITFNGTSGPQRRYRFTETVCATESFCASVGNPNFGVEFQMEECHQATPKVTTTSRTTASSGIRRQQAVRGFSRIDMQCLVSHDRKRNCNNLGKTCDNKTVPCGEVLYDTSLTFKGKSGPTRNFGLILIGCATESFCASVENPDFHVTYQIDECQAVTPGDITTSRTTTMLIPTTTSGCGRIMLATAGVYLQALGCFLMAKAIFDLCFVLSR
ncbi:uncharacterized protein LOC132586073 [Heteronotia binoei]|uniref:uncharacterized protein LOC132586073 n=1 Tax=Heteronotia binoei TaxID=13085 RepID=UPI00293057BB|nr:uncharacterized protein LOC132586073 [Heteronotia binoei]